MEVAQNPAISCVFERGGPSAPPPSPSLGSKRRHGIISISSLLDQCCEELEEKTDKMEVEFNGSQHSSFTTSIPFKRQRTELTVSSFCPQFGAQSCSQETQCGSRPRPTSNFSGHCLVSSVSLNTYSIGSKA